MESPQELRDRLMKTWTRINSEEEMANVLRVEQAIQLSRIAFRLIDLERQVKIIGEIIEEVER